MFELSQGGQGKMHEPEADTLKQSCRQIFTGYQMDAKTESSSTHDDKRILLLPFF